MNGDKPINNKWTFDEDNRIAFSSKLPPVEIPNIKKDSYYKEAETYVNKHFPNNYGEYDMRYPLDEQTSIKWLTNFLEKRLKEFGPYQDAVDNEKHPFGYHSVISPMMNIGLLPDNLVIEQSYQYYLKNKSKIPIQSFEGFIRQVIGWRNYVYTVYTLEGDKLRKTNFLKHTNRINDKWWLAQTGMPPVDTIIKKMVKIAYSHHIERLMYLGNWLLLCKVKPDDVYKIFMEWTIDSYDWVMVPNVYGMSQHATTIMMTRPYFSSSNYIFKMSNFKKSKKDEWPTIWDAVYYSFINDHKDYLRKNYATSRQVKHWDNKTDEEKKELLDIAKSYFKKLFNK
jgi:deoxyribodipyrimidine photolyase-related protein